MKCPHCQHATDKSQVIKCSHCGQSYERELFEEYQYLEYLHDWIQRQGDRLGQQTKSLLAEVEARQGEVRQLLGIRLRPVEEVAKELALVGGTLARAPDWCKAILMGSDTTERFIKYLQQRSHHLLAELGGRSITLEDPRLLEIFDFALDSIPTWLNEGFLTHYEATSLTGQLRRQRRDYRAKMSKQLSLRQGVLGQIPVWVKMEAMSTTFGESLKKHLLEQVKSMEAELGEHPLEASTPPEVINYALEALPGWAKNPAIICQGGDEQVLRNYLLAQRKSIEKPIIAAEAATPALKPIPSPEPVPPLAEPAPPKPPKEKVPFDQWLLSERNIKIALYAGGLLLVIAGLIFIGVNWTRIPGPVKFAITLMVTGLMFLGGYLLFQRPAYRIGGVALLGIASGFLTLNFAVLYIYVLGPAGLRADVMWLIASPLCLLLYMLTAYWTKSDLFTYISLLAAGSTITAALVVIGAPEATYLLTFSIAALALLGTAHLWKKTSLAEFTYQPLMIVSHGLMLLTFVGSLIIIFIGSGLSPLPAGSPWLAYPTLVIGFLFCFLSTLWSRQVVYSFASLIIVGIIATITLFLLDMDLLMYVLTYAILACLGLISARLVQNTSWSKIFRQPLLIVSQAVMPVVILTSILGWILALAFGGIGNVWLVLACLGLAVIFYVTTNVLFKWIAARWAAAMLFPVALVMTLFQLELSENAIGMTMILLAMAYLGIGYLLQRREGQRKSGWPLYSTAYIMAALVTIMSIPNTEDLAKVLFADVVLVAISAAVFGSYWWVYGAVWLFMLPVYLTISLNVPALHYQGLLMGLLGLNYTIIGYVLSRRELRWGGPFLSAAAFLSVVTVVMTWTNPLTATLVLLAVVILYIAASLWLGWTWLLYPALLAVNLILLSTNAFFFDYKSPYEPVLIASYATLGIFLALGGLILRRNEQSRWSWPLYLVATVDLGGAYIVSLYFGGWLTILISIALAALLLTFAWWEQELISKLIKFPLLTYLGLGMIFISTFFIPGVFENIYWDEVMFVPAAGLCALFVITSWLLRLKPLSDIYGAPLRYSGLALMSIPIIVSVVYFNMVSITITLGIAGFTLALDATVRRNVTLAYSSIGVFILVSIAMLFLGNSLAASITFVTVTGLYLFMSLWLENPLLLLPSFFAADLAVIPITNLFIENTQSFVYILTISYTIIGVILLLCGTALRRNKIDRWAWPLYIVGAINLAGAYLASLIIGGWLAVAISILAALLLFSYAWLEQKLIETKVKFALLTYLGIAVIFIGHFYVLELWLGSGMWDFWPVYTAGLCTLFVVVAWFLRRAALESVFSRPLRFSGLALMAIAMIGTLYIFTLTLNTSLSVVSGFVEAFTRVLTLRYAAVGVAITFAIAGLTYAIDAAIRKSLVQVLISVGAFLVTIWAVLLRIGVFELQAYIIPLGLVLVVGGWFVRRREKVGLYQALTLLGLVLLMGTAFAQSIITGVFWYALLLAIESILSVMWGIFSRCRCYVQVGGLALIANAVVQLGPGIISLDRWIQIGFTGIILLGGGLFALFKREEILSTRRKVTDGWRQWNP